MLLPAARHLVQTASFSPSARITYSLSAAVIHSSGCLWHPKQQNCTVSFTVNRKHSFYFHTQCRNAGSKGRGGWWVDPSQHCFSQPKSVLNIALLSMKALGREGHAQCNFLRYNVLLVSPTFSKAHAFDVDLSVWLFSSLQQTQSWSLFPFSQPLPPLNKIQQILKGLELLIILSTIIFPVPRPVPITWQFPNIYLMR